MAQSELALTAPQAAITPMSLIEMAAARGASIEQMAQLFELKLRVEADEARKAFNVSMAAFKADAVRIVKNVTVAAGPLQGQKYADLFGVVNAVTPALSRHGLSHSWKLTKDEPQWMEVTCTIKHDLGHSESVSMGAAPDTGPGRNAIQARGSAKTYLERYTLLAITGMAASGTDTDANTPVDEPRMPEPEYLEWLDGIRQAPNRDALQKVYSDAYKAAGRYGDKTAQGNIIKTKDKAKEGML